jgi:hypothetical protein
VELLLNILWLAASLMLGGVLLYSRSRREAVSANSPRPHSAAWVFYLILIAMLLPIISMTDDLQAMVTPADGEQISRRFEAAVPNHTPVHFHPTVFLQPHSIWFAPVIESHLLDAGQVVYSCQFLPRQSIQGRAPPIAA